MGNRCDDRALKTHYTTSKRNREERIEKGEKHNKHCINQWLCVLFLSPQIQMYMLQDTVSCEKSGTPDI